MKGALYLFLVFNINTIFAENTIIALVNNSSITFNSIESKLLNIKSMEHRVEIVNNKIDNILQLKKANELNIQATPNDVYLTLLSIAKSNNITINQLRSYPEFLSIETEVSEKISILNLQRLITKDIIISEDEIFKKCQQKSTDKSIKQIKIAQIIISKLKIQSENNQDNEIKLFLQKLSKHISKGASFEAFAMLHSQHPSYKNGGKTNWIPVDSPTMMMLNSLKDNEISKVYLTNFGFAIGIKIDERLVSSTLKKCEEKLIYLKAEEFYLAWVEGLREDAYIKIYHDNLK